MCLLSFSLSLLGLVGWGRGSRASLFLPLGLLGFLLSIVHSGSRERLLSFFRWRVGLCFQEFLKQVFSLSGCFSFSKSLSLIHFLAKIGVLCMLVSCMFPWTTQLPRYVVFLACFFFSLSFIPPFRSVSVFFLLLFFIGSFSPSSA